MNTDRKTSEADIEKALRTSSKFTPPVGLKEKLIEQIQMPDSPIMPRPSIATRASGGWRRRWWPVIAPATVSVACAVVLTVQQGQIRELKTSNEALSQAAAAAQANAAQMNNRAASPIAASAEIEQEISRLRDLVAKLKSEIGELRQMQSENKTLSAQLATPAELGLTPQESEALAAAKERALSINCVNNLKQFGLAVRVWALDNGDSNPPTVLCMSNELSTPKILVCPADTARQTAADFQSFTMANCSYEFLAPSEATDKEPQRVLSRCPIHGNIGLCDGSVQRSIAKNHPDWLGERDGKLYFEQPQSAAPQPQPGAAANPNSGTTPASPTEEQMKKFRERYGIAPNGAAPDQKP